MIDLTSSRRAGLILSTLLAVTSCRAETPRAVSENVAVGPTVNGMVVPTMQLIRPAGKSVAYHGRPVDIAVTPDGKTVLAKSNTGLVVVDAETWKVKQELAYPEKSGASLHGLVVSRDGQRAYVTLAQSTLVEVAASADGTWKVARTIKLPAKGKGAKSESYPCGVALSPDEKVAYVCLNVANTLAIVDLERGKVTAEVAVGMAPFDVCLSPDGAVAYVSNWAGRRPREGDRTGKSGGADVVINEKSAAATGTVSVVDVKGARETGQIEVGLHPSDLVLTKDGKRLFVANANSDTVSAVDTESKKVAETISVRPDEQLPFGSASNAVALSADERTLFVANGGNNAVAVVALGEGAGGVRGFIPAGWYPGALAVSGDRLFVANIKGEGSRDPAGAGKWASKHHWGTISVVDAPDEAKLAAYTRQVLADARVPQALKAWEKAQTGVTPVPVPKRVGEPSVFEHVVYVIKENRTYDQVFGDIAKANGDAKLCVFGKGVTPNQHALAEQFVTLDNYYCNGVLSADGHAWATEGMATDYLEKSFGAWVRSYPFSGEDAMAIAPTGFIWDNAALLHGLSFRNFGEMVRTDTKGTHKAYYGSAAEAAKGSKRPTTRFTGALEWTNRLGPEALERYTHPTYPGWNLKIPDAIRVEIFLEEFEQMKAKGQMPNFTTVYLPQDHTSGTGRDAPTPAAMVADNDLAVGKLVEAISRSPFWARTCIFVIEDDPQAGFDHVDGHRSTCLVVSPYTKRGAVMSKFYNQCSVLRTMELIMGLPPMNQMDAAAPVMGDCFAQQADLTPFSALPGGVPLDEWNPGKAALSGKAKEMAEVSERQNFSEPDRADEDALNRVIWFAQKGEAAYPAAWAGAHGRGLKGLHLRLDGSVRDDDDD